MSHIEKDTREAIAAFLPGAIAAALLSYSRFLEEQATKEDQTEAKDFKAYRSSGKSTIAGLFAAWLLYRKPELRILVLAADEILAGKMVRNVKRIIERHPLSAHLKPERADQWASDRFYVHEDVLATPFLTEMREWRPGATRGHDDGLDAAAGAIAQHPVRLKRLYGKGNFGWHRGAEQHKAKTDFKTF